MEELDNSLYIHMDDDLFVWLRCLPRATLLGPVGTSLALSLSLRILDSILRFILCCMCSAWTINRHASLISPPISLFYRFIPFIFFCVFVFFSYTIISFIFLSFLCILCRFLILYVYISVSIVGNSMCLFLLEYHCPFSRDYYYILHFLHFLLSLIYQI